MTEPDKLLASLVFLHSCGNKDHKIRIATYEHQGLSGLSGKTPYTDYLNVLEIDTEAHDVDLERSLIALGAPTPYCLRLQDAWDTIHRDNRVEVLWSSIPLSIAPDRCIAMLNRVALAWAKLVYPIYDAQKGSTTYSASQAVFFAERYMEGLATLGQARAALSEHYQGRTSDQRSAGYEEGFPYSMGPSQYADQALKYAAEFVARPGVGQSLSIFLDVFENASNAVWRDANQDVYDPPITEEARVARKDSVAGTAGTIAEDLFKRRLISVAIQTLAEWSSVPDYIETYSAQHSKGD